MGFFDIFKRHQHENSGMNKDVYVFEAHEYDKVVAVSMFTNTFPSDEKERLAFLRKKACNSFNLPDNSSMEYVSKPNWNAPEVKFNGTAPVADADNVHIGILSYLNKIKLNVKDVNQLRSAIMEMKVSGMPNAGIMWFCVKLNQ